MFWKKNILLYFPLFLSFYCAAQSSTTDSLLRVITSENADSAKVDAYIKLASINAQSDLLKARDFANKAKDLAEKSEYKKGEGYAYKWLGIVSNYQGKYYDALVFSNKSLNIFESLNDEVGTSNLLSNLGIFYSDKGEDAKALEYYLRSLKLAEQTGNKLRIESALANIGVIYFKNPDTYNKSLEYYFKALPYAIEIKDDESTGIIYSNIAEVYINQNDFAKALPNLQQSIKAFSNTSNVTIAYIIMGKMYKQKADYDSAVYYYQKAYTIGEETNSLLDKCQALLGVGQVFMAKGNSPRAIEYFKNALPFAKDLDAISELKDIYKGLSSEYNKTFDFKNAFVFQNELINLYNTENAKKQSFNTATFEYTMELERQSGQLDQLKKEKTVRELELEQEKLAKNFSIAGLSALMVVAIILLININQRKKLNKLLHAQKKEIEIQKKDVETTLVELKSAQSQLIQSEKMASLGELTAGIAHEIQNPLNFVNNFAEVSIELFSEMAEELDKGQYEEANAIADDIKLNLEKIHHHGRRADGIVKGMFQHSRRNSDSKESTDINALADEYLRLAYHGLRAKDNSFNSKLDTDFDESIGNINIISQDMGRAILNLITNAFFAVDEKKKQNGKGYEPRVSVSSKKIPAGPNDSGGKGKVELRVADNGNGIPKKVLDKIFQPFFTTKPTGQGTGLGLSLSYDIIKAHGGELKVETTEGEGATFIIQLPL